MSLEEAFHSTKDRGRWKSVLKLSKCTIVLSHNKEEEESTMEVKLNTITNGQSKME